jgi:hypothetical protein
MGFDPYAGLYLFPQRTDIALSATLDIQAEAGKRSILDWCGSEPKHKAYYVGIGRCNSGSPINFIGLYIAEFFYYSACNFTHKMPLAALW